MEDWALLVHTSCASWLVEISWFLGPALVASRHTHLQAVCYERSLSLPPKLKAAGRLAGWPPSVLAKNTSRPAGIQVNRGTQKHTYRGLGTPHFYYYFMCMNGLPACVLCTT